MSRMEDGDRKRCWGDTLRRWRLEMTVEREGGLVALKVRLLAVVAGLLAGLLSLIASWVPSYWSDEVATVRATTIPWSQLVTFLQHKDVVHGVYYAIMHVWVGAFGISALATRSLSALAVAGAAYGLIVLGTTMNRVSLGFVAAGVFAILPRTTYMGMEARSSALTACAAVWLTVLLVRAAQSSRSRSLVLYAVVLALSNYLFIYSALLAVPHFIYLLMMPRGSQRWRRWILAVGAAFAASVPIFAIAVQQRGQISWLSDQPVVNIWTILVEPYFDSSWAVAAFGLIVTAVVVVRLARRRDPTMATVTTLALAWAILPPILLLLANAIDGPLYLARYLSFCTPGAALIIAIFVTRLSAKYQVGILTLVACLAAPTFVAQRTAFAKNGGSDLAEVGSYIASHAHRGDAIFFVESGPATLRPRLALYAYPQDFAATVDIALVRPFDETGKWTFSDQTKTLASLAHSLPNYERLWLVKPGAGSACTAGANGTLLSRLGFGLTLTHSTHRETICEFTR
jgi:mannosyltransferase